jgi:hypothetical protein
MRRLLNQAANAAVKYKGGIFEILYRRYVPRLGHKQTIKRPSPPPRAAFSVPYKSGCPRPMDALDE